MQTLTLCLGSFLVLCAGWAGGSPPSSYFDNAAGQTAAAPTPTAYVRLIRAYRSGKSVDVIDELSGRETRDVRKAVASVAQSLQSSEDRLRELRALEVGRRNGEMEQAKYGALRSSALKRLEAAVKPIGIDASLEETKDRLETELQGLLRGAIGLHTAIAARSWLAGQDSGVADHLEFAKAYVRSLVARDITATSLWCKTAGMLLTASDRVGDALRTYEQCLAWHPGDAWLLLGRGSAFESAAVLFAALPPGATVVHGPDDSSDSVQLRDQAIADYETALKASPDLTEARIRLARMLLGKGDTARAAIELVRDRPNLETVLRYWASLIGGAIEEARNDDQKAAAHYRAALQLYPRAQSAAIALSRVLSERRGRREEGVTTLRSSVSPALPRTTSDDPWKYYRVGQAWRAADWLREVAHWSRM